MTTINLGLINDSDRLKKNIKKVLGSYELEKSLQDHSDDFQDYLSNDTFINSIFINDFCVLLYKMEFDNGENPIGQRVEIRSCDYPKITVASTSLLNVNGNTCCNELVDTILEELLRQLSNLNCRKLVICSYCLNRMLPDGKKFCDDCELKVSTFKDDTCSICLDKEETLSVWNVLKTCGHIFHQSCFKSLIGQSSSRGELLCPICREIVGIHSVKIL